MRRVLWVGLIVLLVIPVACGYRAVPREAHDDEGLAASVRTTPPPVGYLADVDEFAVIERAPTRRPRQEDPRGGELRTKLGDKDVPLPLKHTDVKAQVTVHIGSVTVTQQYHNPYDGKIEAVYVFPLPENGAVRDFVMTIGDRRIRGIVREREEARKIYEQARARGHVASLLSQDRANIFTQSVANIEPGTQIDVSITYFHALKYVDGEFEFWFPMVVGPRFNPPGTTGGVGAVPRGGRGWSGQRTEVQYLRPDEISAHDIALAVDIDAGVAIDNLHSPTHVIHAERPGEGRARVTLSPNDRIPNKDFVLRWRVAERKGPRAALATFRDEKGDGYFTLMLHPPAELGDVPPQPREMIFVLDCSGSMSGEPLALAKRALERCLRRLSPNDTFQVIRFSDSASAMGDRPVAATPENVRRGLGYVESLTSEGGTRMETGIRAALDAPADPGRYRIVSFMTDGYIGSDREILGLVRKHVGHARIFSFGVGSSINRFLLEGMARLGRGVCAILTLDESSEKAVDALYRRIERPALSDIRIDWGAMAATQVSPNPLPDLFVGRPMIVSGRFSGRGAAKVRLSGTVGGKPHESILELNLDDPGLKHAALAAVWARSKIEDLTDEMTFSPVASEIAGQVKSLALTYGLVSDFTSFVAVDASRATEGDHGTTVVQPVPVPKGTRYDTTVPEKKPD